MLSLLTDPFASEFMVRAGLGVIALGVSGPICGCWVVQRRLVYLTDAMSHAILAGVAAATLLGASLTLGAFAAAAVMTVAVAFLVLRAGVSEDSAIGISGHALLAFGVIGVSAQSDPRALSHVLFGNPLTVTSHDVIVQWTVASGVAAAAWFLAPLLSSTTFDSVHARTVGIRVGIIDTLLVVGLGMVVVIGLTTVGVLMAVSMIVAPAVAARIVTRRMATMIPVSVAMGTGAGIVGLIVSYHLSLPSGPVVALCVVTEVVIAILIRRPHGERVQLIADRPADNLGSHTGR